MSDLNQKLGFDVSDVLAAIQSLDSGLANLQNRFTSMGGTFGAFNSSGTAAATAAAKAGTAFRTDLGQGGAAAQASTERLTTSLGLLSRIVFTQNVISGLRIIKQGFAEQAESRNRLSNEDRRDSHNRTDRIRRFVGRKSASAERRIQSAANRRCQIEDIFAVEWLHDNRRFSQRIECGVQVEQNGHRGCRAKRESVERCADAFGADSSQAETFAAKFFDAIKLGHLTAADLASNLDKVRRLCRALACLCANYWHSSPALAWLASRPTRRPPKSIGTLSAIKQSPEAADAIKGLATGRTSAKSSKISAVSFRSSKACRSSERQPRSFGQAVPERAKLARDIHVDE